MLAPFIFKLWLFCLLVCPMIFFLIVRRNILGKRNCCKYLWWRGVRCGGGARAMVMWLGLSPPVSLGLWLWTSQTWRRLEGPGLGHFPLLRSVRFWYSSQLARLWLTTFTWGLVLLRSALASFTIAFFLLPQPEARGNFPAMFTVRSW